MAELEHDPRLIEHLALLHEGNAAAHMRHAAERQHKATDAPQSGWTQHHMLGASGFVVAASYWSQAGAAVAFAKHSPFPDEHLMSTNVVAEHAVSSEKPR